jgi:hypothetical protein
LSCLSEPRRYVVDQVVSADRFLRFDIEKINLFLPLSSLFQGSVRLMVVVLYARACFPADCLFTDRLFDSGVAVWLLRLFVMS